MRFWETQLYPIFGLLRWVALRLTQPCILKEVVDRPNLGQNRPLRSKDHYHNLFDRTRTVARGKTYELLCKLERNVYKLQVPKNGITGIINGQRGITVDTALRLGYYFGTGAELWMNLQKNYELKVAEQTHDKAIRESIKPYVLVT